MDAWGRWAALTAGLLAGAIPRGPATVGGVIAADLGLAGDQPFVLVDVAGARRRMAYLPPHAIRVGGAVLCEPEDAAADAPWLVTATNYQVTPRTFGGASSGSGLGYAAAGGAGGGAGTPSTDWATDMTDPTNADGSLLPLTLGEVGQ